MSQLQIRPLGYALAAEVRGLDLRQPVTQPLRDELYAAWLRHQVLVFPDQDLTPEQHIAFSRNFGDLDNHALQPASYLHPDHEEILLVTNRPQRNGEPSQTRRTGRNWHADLTYTRQPAKGSLLLCKERPSIGGDTLWANMHLAYDTLSPRMRAFVDGLEAVHGTSLGTATMKGRNPADTAEMIRRNPPVIHPLAPVHPETGRRALLAGERIREIVGFSDEESKALLAFLNKHATSHEFIYRHRWSVNDIVLWDNRNTQHLALPDFNQDEPRTLLRCSLKGEATGRLADVEEAPTRDAMLQALAAIS